MFTHTSRKKYNQLLFFTLTFLWIGMVSCKAESSQKIFEQALGSPISMTCGPGNLTAGDVNDDNIADIIATCGDNRTVTIFIGRGNGQFDVAAGSPIQLQQPPNEIEIGDMNNDGHVDLVIASHDSYDVLILPGNGKGGFTGGFSVTMKKGSAPHTHGLGVGDVNGDKNADIVTANSNDNDIAVVLNEKGNSFVPSPGSPFPVSTSAYPLTLGDVNRDNYLDIVSTSTNSKNLSLLLGDGRGNFRRKDIQLRTPNPWYTAIGDFNNDSIPDLAITHAERNELTVLKGDAQGQFTEVPGSPFYLGTSAWHIAINDFNRDGYADIIAAANNGVRLMLGDGVGKFMPASGSPFLTGKGTWHLDVVDLNGDRRPDIVTSNLETKNLSVLLGR